LYIDQLFESWVISESIILSWTILSSKLQQTINSNRNFKLLLNEVVRHGLKSFELLLILFDKRDELTSRFTLGIAFQKDIFSAIYSGLRSLNRLWTINSKFITNHASNIILGRLKEAHQKIKALCLKSKATFHPLIEEVIILQWRDDDNLL
jgi:hypothetical protein